MKQAVPIVLAVIVLIGLAVVIRGSMYVREVRQQEAQIQQAIEHLAQPGFTLARQPRPIPTSKIWTAWILEPFPRIRSFFEIISGDLYWHPGQKVLMDAVYRTDAAPETIRARYLEQFQPIQDSPMFDGGYALSVQVENVHLQLSIGPRDFMPDGEIYYANPNGSFGTRANAVEILAGIPSAEELEQIKAYPIP
ncbi:MAG: hypothetical protein JOZ51_00065 [Chloroflexi bacterium]|nr:hypothetical protein [Chloroflexota bacterium]